MRVSRTVRILTTAAAAVSLTLAGARTPAAGAGAATHQSDREQRAYDAGLAAYVVGYPLVVMRRTQAVQSCRFGINTLENSARLYTSDDRDVVTPNNDTIYSMAWLDLRPGPQRLTLPPESDRYFSFEFLDIYTEVFDVAHGRTDQPSDVLVVGPDWHGQAPTDARVVRSRTNDVWVIGRTFVNGPDDLTAAQEFQKGYHLSGPEGTPVVAPGTDCATLPKPQNIAEAGVGFFDELDAGLKADPPTKAEEERLRPLYGLGVNPGDAPGEITDPATLRGLARAVTDGEAQILARSRVREQQANGWSWSLGHGIWGTDYLRRAAIAMAGLGALPATEALYYRANSDPAGAPLTGATPYRLHFPADALPPSGKNAFWSITMYDLNTRFLVDNPIDRYAINSATPGVVRNDDGSIDIYLQHTAPLGHESNWLPAPEGRFYTILRVYRPQPQALDGTWVPPALIVGGSPAA